jgi:hypothetical protein
VHLLLRRTPPETVIAHLAQLLLAAGAATTTVGGTVGFHVHGATGGPWVVDLAVPGGDWSSGDPEAFARAGTRVLAFASVFAAVAFAPDLLPALLSAGELAVLGDRQRLNKLSTVLGARGSPLGTRLTASLDVAHP